jgi:hypothetical protein
LGGVEGMLYLETNENNVVYQLMWLPSEDGRNISYVSDIQVLSLKEGLQNKFDIILFKDDEVDDNKFKFECSDVLEKDYSFFINGEIIDNDVNKIVLNIYDNELFNEVLAKEQDDINEDF